MYFEFIESLFSMVLFKNIHKSQYQTKPWALQSFYQSNVKVRGKRHTDQCMATWYHDTYKYITNASFL